MTALNTEKLINQANDEEIKCMLFNIATYADMNDYTKHTNNNKEDLKELQDDGWVLDITPGTYNGSIDKTDYVSELTTKNIYFSLIEEVYLDSFQDLISDWGEYDSNESRQVRLLTEYYNVFTIGQHLYIDYD